MTFDVTAVVTASNETWSLERTVQVVVEENRQHLAGVIIVVPKCVTPECFRVAHDLADRYRGLVTVHVQTRPYLGGALQESFSIATGKYTAMLAGDLETDPELLKVMIAAIRTDGCDIITASRWCKDGSFTDYGPAKKLLNFIFQRIFATLYGVRLTDMTYGYRIFRTDVMRKVKLRELRHPFFLESLVKPLRLGCTVRELPARWERRTEGESAIRLWDFVGYFRVGFMTLVTPRSWLVAGEASRLEDKGLN